MEAKYTEPVSIIVIVLKAGADSIQGPTAPAQSTSLRPRRCGLRTNTAHLLDWEVLLGVQMAAFGPTLVPPTPDEPRKESRKVFENFTNVNNLC